MNRILLVLLLLIASKMLWAQEVVDPYGAVIRSDTHQKNIYLCFTGHDFDEGFEHVLKVLDQHEINASFFLTGDFVRTHKTLVKNLVNKGHYVGAHSDKHLLYCDWSKRDSLLVSPKAIKADIQDNLLELGQLGIQPKYFMPPYEWYNSRVVAIASELGQTTVNFSPGTKSNADYTTPDMPNYITSVAILRSIYTYEEVQGLNGFHLLIHPGTSPLRTDKLYYHLDDLLKQLLQKGYQFSRF